MRQREAFRTGKPHQSAVASWARVRLADQGGCYFDDFTHHIAPKQTGCLFADGVGLGKTWEALAAVALLLDKDAWRKRQRRTKRAKRGRRVLHRRRQAHVLVLLPPGLVAKWSQELRNPVRYGFQGRLKTWAERVPARGFVLRTLEPENCFEIRRRADLESLPRGQIKRGKYTLPAGTYLCNWNVFLGPGGRGRDRVTALKNGRWDVVVVDEAHHKQARKALETFKYPARTLLLTATPFQLDMTEVHGLTRHLVEGKTAAHKVLQRGAVQAYARAADRAFDQKDSAPTPSQRRDAEEVLGQLIACSKVGRQRRHYFAIDATGHANPIPAPTELEAAVLPNIFEAAIQAPDAFSESYLLQRLQLAKREAKDSRKHVAVELRKLLSVRNPPAPVTPRLSALRRWARKQFVEDLRMAMGDGKPRKLLLFTHLKTNVAAVLNEALKEELEAAYRQIARSDAWRAARAAAPKALERVLTEVKQRTRTEKLRRLLDAFGRAARHSLFFDLFGSKAFARNAKAELLRIVGAEDLRSATMHDEAATAWYSAQARRKERSTLAVAEALAKAPTAATFTGDETRRERDAIAEAFKTPLAPWILVATNVGSEGIDLHTYSRHLVHFDLEWNPARMEQREGRIDRLGRALTGPARVYYLLVKDTYDERMFHQLIARQRWHGVLLGRKALQLKNGDGADARILSRRQAETMSLNLDPRAR